MGMHKTNTRQTGFLLHVSFSKLPGRLFVCGRLDATVSATESRGLLMARVRRVVLGLEFPGDLHDGLEMVREQGFRSHQGGC